MIYTKITDKLERAARNGERLHLDVNHVRPLAASPLYAMLCAERMKEIQAAWRGDQRAQPPVASSSATSGLNPAPSGESGSLHGMMQALVHDAEERQASATAAKLSHRSRRRKH